MTPAEREELTYQAELRAWAEMDAMAHRLGGKREWRRVRRRWRAARRAHYRAMDAVAASRAATGAGAWWVEYNERHPEQGQATLPFEVTR